MKVNQLRCTETVLGTIKEVKAKGQDFPTMISVEYQAAGTIYIVTESIKLKSEKIKIGIFPVGQKKVPVMGETRVGSLVKVNYNPDDPDEAYIVDNVGKLNV